MWWSSGMAVVRNKDLTGAVGKVNMSDLQKAPVHRLTKRWREGSRVCRCHSTEGQPARLKLIMPWQ